MCPSGLTSNQAATYLSMNGIPDSPPPLCNGVAGLGLAGKKAGFVEKSRDGISSATTAAYGPTTSIFMFIQKELPYQHLPATRMLLRDDRSISPLDAPVPPDPGAERISLPDFNLYRPIIRRVQLRATSMLLFHRRGTGPVENSAIANQAGVSSSYPYEKSCPTCAASPSLTTPYGYAAQSYKAVYPVPSICKCNEYYVQSSQGRLGTVAGVFCGEWLPIWSKVSRPGAYWSFEWTACGSGTGYYCSPEVKNFGYKSAR